MNNTRYSIGAGSSFTPPTAAYNPLTDAYIANVVHYSTFTQTDSTTGYPLYGTGLTRTYNPNPFNGKQINQFVGVDTNIVGIASGGYYAYANKDNLKQELKMTYKVTPTKINILNTQPRDVIRRGKPGRVAGFKKAVFTLKKGDKIDIA